MYLLLRTIHKEIHIHKEEWGKFVDVKINAPILLQREIEKKRVGKVWVSGVCDPYQPLEKKYELTRECLEILSAHHWPITIQTKSPLVTRDLDLLRKVSDIEIGLTITTADQTIHRLMARSPPVLVLSTPPPTAGAGTEGVDSPAGV